MNQRTSKLLRNLIGVKNEDPTTRRIYRRLKKEYSRLPPAKKQDFLDGLELLNTKYTP